MNRVLMVVVSVLVASPAAGQDLSLDLICNGTEYGTETITRDDSGKLDVSGSAQATMGGSATGSATAKTDEQATITRPISRPGVARIRVNGVQVLYRYTGRVPALAAGDWKPLQKVDIGPDRINGNYKAALFSSVKVRIDRDTGSLAMFYLDDLLFDGKCEKVQLATPKF